MTIGVIWSTITSGVEYVLSASELPSSGCACYRRRSLRKLRLPVETSRPCLNRASSKKRRSRSRTVRLRLSPPAPAAPSLKLLCELMIDCSYQRRCVCRASGASGTLLRAVDRSVWLTRSEVRADSSQETHQPIHLSPPIPIRLVVTYALTLLDLKHSGT